MRRPLLIIFLTVFVNLIGFGIIIPLLPFYAQTFGASPLAVGLLFAAYSLSQLIAAPALGDFSDRWGRRPILIFSLLGTVVSFVMLALAQSLWLLFLARVVDGLSGGNISTARAYIADITEAEDRAKAYGLIGAAFGLGFILGPALGGLFARISYTAPIWVAAGLTLVATGLAWFWLPETVHKGKAGGLSPFRVLPEALKRPGLRLLLGADFLYWFSFAVYQTTFALFGAMRFHFDASMTGYLLAGFGAIGVVVQVGLVGPVVKRFGERWTLIAGLVCGALGLASAAWAPSTLAFAFTLIPAAVGVGLCNPSLSSLLSRAAHAEEQGRVQGAAGSLESLGRTLGPVWGNGALERFSAGTAYTSAAAVLLVTALVAFAYRPVAGADQGTGTRFG
ncbi:MAG TPA: MFS transporter [Vicinamibacterales bacterium]|nr:MFS transporter [Vicinamibacterales bacterium]